MGAKLRGPGDSIGARVQAAREALGWSRALLAEYAGTSPKTIEAIERGQVESPGSILVGKIAAAMGVTPNDLIPPQEIAELPRPGQRLEVQTIRPGIKRRRPVVTAVVTAGRLGRDPGALLRPELSAAA